MTLRVRSLGLGSLSGSGPVVAMKTALNLLEVATGKTGRYNAGDASSSVMTGNSGFFAFKATYHLLIDASQATTDVTQLAAGITGGLSDAVGKAFDGLDEAAKLAAGAVKQSLSLLDKFDGAPAFVIWNADQISGKKYIGGFIEDQATKIATLAGLLLEAMKKGLVGSGAPSPDSVTDPTAGMSAREILKARVQGEAVAVQRISADSDTTLVVKRPSKLGPTIVVGGAVAVAAALFLTK